MKFFFLHFVALSASIPSCSIETDTKKEITRAPILQMRQEIERLEKKCVPVSGTSRTEVERKFGTGQPFINAKTTKDYKAPKSSPYRAYNFCPNGILIIRYDTKWNVQWGGFIDPYATKGGVGGVAVPVAKQLAEVKPRLEQMRRIYMEYGKRFGQSGNR